MQVVYIGSHRDQYGLTGCLSGSQLSSIDRLISFTSGGLLLKVDDLVAKFFTARWLELIQAHPESHFVSSLIGGCLDFPLVQDV